MFDQGFDARWFNLDISDGLNTLELLSFCSINMNSQSSTHFLFVAALTNFSLITLFSNIVTEIY